MCFHICSLKCIVHICLPYLYLKIQELYENETPNTWYSVTTSIDKYAVIFLLNFTRA